MVAVLDQYEVEYKETYTSGTYDQVVMGDLYYQVVVRGIKKYVYGNRGVVYGHAEAASAPQPGTSIFDQTSSKSYRLQPYREKAGNIRAAKFQCDSERIYDTLAPDPISCFKKNGADVARGIQFVIRGGFPVAVDYPTPGAMSAATGIDNVEAGFIMFDCIAPTGKVAANLNPVVDRNWTRSFPFEPRYYEISRKSKQQFKNLIEAKYSVNFTDSTITTLSKKRKMKGGVFVGTVGRNDVAKNRTNGNADVVTTWKHRWACDINVDATVSSGKHVTSSCSDDDTLKVLFGFGDINTIFYTASYTDSSSTNGYKMMGTNNWPDFRAQAPTNTFSSDDYDYITGSLWCTSPIIRGWKYGLHSALPDYSSAYFRQGRYGQFRDMLEQRQYTKFFSRAPLKINSTTADSVITVKFVNEDGELVDPVSTQSQNLSVEATSSLPYFDLLQRNRPT